MVAHVCHVYGYLPQQVLDMRFRHFVMLSEHIDTNERRRARYVALAFNDPSLLFEEEAESEATETKFDVDELLADCNGV